MSTPRITQAEFIRRCCTKHGSRWDYSKTVFTYTRNDVVITCATHGDFTQKAGRHLRGAGCPKCKADTHSLLMSERISVSRSEFLKRARSRFGYSYKYSGAYIGYTKPIKIKCALHGWFTCTPSNHVRSATGCPECGRNRSTTSQFIERARKVHGTKYDYSETVCTSSSNRVIVICKQHGPFEVTQARHLKASGKSGCSKCGYAAYSAQRIAKSSETFIARLKAIHGDRYDYSRVEYTGSGNLIEILCPEHGPFLQKAGTHLKGKGCRACAFLGHSKVSIEWIEAEAKRRKLHGVWHAANGGEYLVPGTRFRVDGFHEATKTIFEFYGDCFHGNPKLYRRTDKPHPFRDLTAYALYRKTMDREAYLKSLGYTVVSIWEKDYRESLT